MGITGIKSETNSNSIVGRKENTEDNTSSRGVDDGDNNSMQSESGGPV